MGRRVRIQRPLRLVEPKFLKIGDDAEIRFGCALYASQHRDFAIDIGPSCRLKEYCILDSYGGFIRLGRQVLLGMGSTIHGHGGVEVGDYSLIGQRVCIFSSDHVFENPTKLIQEQGEVKKKTIIGRNVWVGAGVIVLRGVKVGDNSVVAAGSVVKHDVPPATLVAGVPARALRRIG